ncbi:PspC domain-containing protein [Nocardioides sp. URHA0032]|uniref:PspC domain-containing protein n=1 Tax=Nocardioides sp. URHA0032 TaxID=1380388 RepID=UPI00048B8172|nr:PspC domain-containing protein [Nocardioides sp. URHA0032]
MTTTPPEAPSGGPTGPRVTGDQVRDLGRLRRSRADRKVAGVAGGLARHLDVDPLILRVAFVVLVFFGGAGLILYGACWLLVPDDGAERAAIHLDDRSRSVALLIVGVVAAAALIGDSWGAFWFPWPVAVVALIALWLLTRNNPQSPAAPAAAPPPPAASGPVPPAYPAAPQTYQTYQPYVPPVTYTRPPNPRKRGPILFWFTLALIAFGEGLLGIIDLAGANVAGPAYPALAVAICGAMLVLGAFFGRAGGIILLGLVAAVALAASTAADKIDTDSVSVAPTTAAAVDSTYSLDVGEQHVDLTRVADLDSLDGRTIHVDGDLGSIDVTLPEGVRVLVDARVHGPGDIKLFGDEHGGIDIEQQRTAGAPGDPTVTLDLELSVGTIEVTR